MFGKGKPAVAHIDVAFEHSPALAADRYLRHSPIEKRDPARCERVRSVLSATSLGRRTGATPSFLLSKVINHYEATIISTPGRRLLATTPPPAARIPDAGAGLAAPAR
jgi:hypothetical protein